MLMSAELERLRRENAELRLAVSFSKKSRSLLRLRTQPVEAYRVIEAEKPTYPVERMCELLEMSPLGVRKMAQIPRRRSDAGPAAAGRVGRQSR